ncbi:MAG: ACT domain-containing protein [Verrucomicrobiia bacterium]
MQLKQLSLFLENKPGAISRPMRLLAKAGFNILTLSIADTDQFGILRLIVRDWEKAKQLLEQEGFVVKVTDMVAVEVADRPGGLAEILDLLEKAGTNVAFMYAFTEKRKGHAVLIFRFDNPDAAIRSLLKKGINVVDSGDLLKQLEG